MGRALTKTNAIFEAEKRRREWQAAWQSISISRNISIWRHGGGGGERRNNMASGGVWWAAWSAAGNVACANINIMGRWAGGAAAGAGSLPGRIGGAFCVAAAARRHDGIGDKQAAWRRRVAACWLEERRPVNSE